MRRFFLLFPLSLWLPICFLLLLFQKQEALLPLTGGMFFGIVDFLLLEKDLQKILEGGKRIRFMRLAIVVSGLIVLTLLSRSPLWVVLGFTFFPLTLMAYSIKEALRA